MKMTIVCAHSPKWSNQDHSSITLNVMFAELNKEVPFTASLKDPEPHGRELYKRAVAKEFGEIAAYKPFTYTKEQMENHVRNKRNMLLRLSDWSQLPDVASSVKDIWANYRNELRCVPEQDGFPFDVKWPKTPA